MTTAAPPPRPGAAVPLSPTPAMTLSASPPQTAGSTAAVTSTPSTPPNTTDRAVNTSPAIITAAIIAVIGVGITALITWRLGLRTAKAVKRSSKAAKQAVRVSRQTAKAAGLRAEADALSKRYHDAAAQMGDAQPHVRIAGVYAMTRLADDWLEQRQACIDVLCAYLRVPIDDLDAHGLRGEAEVRRTIVKRIGDHVNEHTKMASWSDYRFDLSQTVITDLVLYDAVFNGTVNFAHSEFRGTDEIAGVRIGKSVSFDNCLITGTLKIGKATVDGVLIMNYMQVPAGSTLSISLRSLAVHASPTVALARLRLEGRLILSVAPTVEAQGAITMRNLAAGPASQTRVVPVPPIDPTAELLPEISCTGWRISAESKYRLSPKLLDREQIKFVPAAHTSHDEPPEVA